MCDHWLDQSHLHVWPMQQIDVNGAPETDTTWRDVVNIPAGSRVTLRIDFTGITGRTVYRLIGLPVGA